eukprot:TRINITY_DN1352_c0_g2_i3.p1 TRINITY_DN1352_c0_g2~~TRINITY_DN1352_c0_g2_i3.p1  ORF type:complete len:396 (-),score=66.86 TRINITY_DN1352_c0_g2_i3:236-1423(-)
MELDDDVWEVVEQIFQSHKNSMTPQKKRKKQPEQSDPVTQVHKLHHNNEMEIINLVSDDEQEVHELGIGSSQKCFKREKQLATLDDEQVQVLTTTKVAVGNSDNSYKQEIPQVDLDDELEQDMKEAKVLANHSKKLCVDQQEMKIQSYIETIAKEMANQLGGGGEQVDIEVLKESLAATKSCYKQGEDWYDRWTMAAQDYMVTLLENQNEANEIGAAMAQSLREKKSVSEMCLSQLFTEFQENSYLLKGVFEILENQSIIRLETLELTTAFRKLLELEKKCFHWYGCHREAVEAYFDAQLRESGLQTLKNKIDKLSVSKYTERTRKKNSQKCEQEIRGLLTCWYQKLSESVLQFEQNDINYKKQHVVPEIFHKFLTQQKKQQFKKQLDEGIIVID